MNPCADCAAGCLPALSGPAAEQPYGEEFTAADGIFIKEMRVPRAGTLIPQHAHAYDHVTYVAAGRFRVWCDGALRGEFGAPCPVPIPAGTKHAFLSLEDGSVALCIHTRRARPAGWKSSPGTTFLA